ncbi:protein CELLULOSE SYNTHASE INTERACTIVE 1 isoform X2 [Physcomitrium patens]|nr:protein CELLULOSE SYNTHASE INTERACTIVE 1-like isoform X2 [Physcomitrium patens]XP_024360311.1 protein CELLULOSE SYNTHASE INTERACTIVE 1-like isoform X2 [Physcomitrium patens]|eukprot:XP_024360310.1 protein CELLULOSE SYNTHASE INTERACTIVE 1-like isoform X2 [Physcomitrella patens]
MAQAEELRSQTPETLTSAEAPQSAPVSKELPETPESLVANLLTRQWSNLSDMEEVESGAANCKIEQILAMLSAPASAEEEEEEVVSDGIVAKMSDCIEQLRSTSTSTEEKEITSRIVFELADTQEAARAAVGSHPQAVPALVGLVRSGSLVARVNAAAILGVLCKEEDLRVKVLLGGCIPPLLALLKSDSPEAQTVAARALNAVSQGGAKDHVGSKIFSTEGVVVSLWEQLQPRLSLDPSLPGLLTGALRNLCNSSEGFWPATLDAGGVGILVRLLASGHAQTERNAASLMASLMSAVEDSGELVLHAGAMGPLLQLLSAEDVSVRAEAAGALQALSANNWESRYAIKAAGGMDKLIRETVGTSKGVMQDKFIQALQENALGASANILGGLPALIVTLGEIISSKGQSEVKTAEAIGALAYALKVLDDSDESVEAVHPLHVEEVLMKHLGHHTSVLIQERTIGALMSLYGNGYLARGLEHSEGKKMVVGLIMMASGEMQESLTMSLMDICCGHRDLWQALRGRDGVQLLISLLGQSTEQQQEYAASLLSIMTQEIEESKWAITAAGGIPPLVQLLESGSEKAIEDSAVVLGNLCNHSEDIRVCVETAEAVPALLGLLKNAGYMGQGIAARALTQLVQDSDASTISNLTALLTEELPVSKVHVLHVVGCLLSVASQEDIFQEGAPAYEALETLIELLRSGKCETQEHSASVLAEIFACRPDVCESPDIVKAIPPLIKLVSEASEQIALQAARALGALFGCIRQNQKVASVGKDAMLPLISLARSSSISVAEVATTAVANLMLDVEIAEKAPAEDIILPLTRTLQEGSLEGKEHAAGAVARLLRSQHVNDVMVERVHQCGTVLALVSLLAAGNSEESSTSEALEALASLARTTSRGGSFGHPLWAVLAEAPFSMSPLVTCLAVGEATVQGKAIEVLSRLCRDQPVVLGDLIADNQKCIAALADRIIQSSSLEVKVGGTALLICAAKEHRLVTMVALREAGFSVELVRSLVDMISFKSLEETGDELGTCDSEEEDVTFTVDESGVSRRKEKAHDGADGGVFLDYGPAQISGGTAALWLLCVIASIDGLSKLAITEAGAIEVVTEKLAIFAPNAREAEVEDNGSTWVSALLLAILFSDRDVTRAPAIMRAIPSLVTLLKSQETIDRYFAAQALASLVCNGNRGTLLAVANSGAAGGLIQMLGMSASDISKLVSLSKEFGLHGHPDEVALEWLFRVDDIRVGATARKAIPMLVNLLKPLADRPGAAPLALGLLTQLANDNNVNKLAMTEAGALDGLTKYLSIGPKDVIEEATADLLRILFTSPELRRHDSAVCALEQLVAVLRFGSRGSRLSAARALQELFAAEHIRVGHAAGQAIAPLVEMLSSGVEKEQRVAISALITLSEDNPSKVLAIADSEANAVEGVCRVLLSDCSLELKEDAANLCRTLVNNPRVRSTPEATCCISPLVALLDVDSPSAQYAGACALDNLLDDEQQAEAVAANGAVMPLVDLVVGTNFSLHESAVSGLIKLAKDRPLCKLDMVKGGIINNVLDILPEAPDSLCALCAELLRILTNNSNIAKGVAAAKVVEPLFFSLTRSDLSTSGLHSAMQVLVNIFEKPQRLANLTLTPNQAIEPLVLLLDSSSQPVQQLAAELLSHLLALEQFQRDVFTQQAVAALVRLVGVGVPSLQKEAIRALESASSSWPNAIADAGGITELSGLLLQTDPQPLHALWEAAALVLSNVLRFSSQYYFKVPLAVLVKLLRSSNVAIVVVALNALILLEREDSCSAEGMAEAGAVEALLELLRCHQCEEAAARLLEALFNNFKVRDAKAARLAISPLSQYLLDPQTRTQPARLLAALALGDLFQHEGLSRSSDAVSACRALVNLLEDQPTEEMKVVSVCALQNVVVSSRANKRAVAEAGGVQVVQELLASSNSESVGQAAILIGQLFANHTIQEYASSEMILALAAALEKDLWATASVNEDVARALTVMLGNFPRLRSTDEATQSIAQLVGALKAGNEVAQEAALDGLFLLQEDWADSPAEVGKAQAMAAAEAIPILQYLVREGPPRFVEKAEILLQCLPGSLVVTVKQGLNLKQSVGSTNAFCKLTLGNGPPRQTKVVNQSVSPQWKQGFAWAYDYPPKGQKLHISCRNKGAFGKGSLGKVTIQIDRVVMQGTISGQYTLQPETNRDGTPRTLEVEFQWSNR